MTRMEPESWAEKSKINGDVWRRIWGGGSKKPTTQTAVTNEVFSAERYVRVKETEKISKKHACVLGEKANCSLSSTNSAQPFIGIHKKNLTKT